MCSRCTERGLCEAGLEHCVFVGLGLCVWHSVFWGGLGPSVCVAATRSRCSCSHFVPVCVIGGGAGCIRLGACSREGVSRVRRWKRCALSVHRFGKWTLLVYTYGGAGRCCEYSAQLCCCCCAAWGWGWRGGGGLACAGCGGTCPEWSPPAVELGRSSCGVPINTAAGGELHPRAECLSALPPCCCSWPAHVRPCVHACTLVYVGSVYFNMHVLCLWFLVPCVEQQILYTYGYIPIGLSYRLCCAHSSCQVYWGLLG